MARIPRSTYLSNYYHVMMRGVGQMNLFRDNVDRGFFLKKLAEYKEELAVSVYVYCLMDNHVHMLIRVNSVDDMSKFFQKLGGSYATYFNGRYGRVGHVFQNRYRSEPIVTEKYLLTVFRYILRNPEAAGICTWKAYRWSSARAYIYQKSSDKITEIEAIGELFASREELIRFASSGAAKDDPCPIDFNEDSMNRAVRMPDGAVTKLIIRHCNVEKPSELRIMDKISKRKYLKWLVDSGASMRQLERLTGISRSTIQRSCGGND